MSIGIAWLIIIGVFAGVVWLQVFLSKMESRWPGLVLPIISVVVSSLLVLTNFLNVDNMSGLELFGMLAITLLLANIPTIIFLAIYFALKANQKKKKAVEKMNIQDLN